MFMLGSCIHTLLSDRPARDSGIYGEQFNPNGELRRRQTFAMIGSQVDRFDWNSAVESTILSGSCSKLGHTLCPERA
jgi:hypothetical protein